MSIFIIRYSPRWCEVFNVHTLDCCKPIRPSCLIDEYEAQLPYLERGLAILGSEELFACNNSWWGRIEAETAADAFTIFIEKLHTQTIFKQRLPEEVYKALGKKLREGIPFTIKEET